MFRHLSDPNEDFALQLSSLALALTSDLPDIAPDAVVVRSMDWSKFVKSGVQQKKYGTEGVLLATARRSVRLTESLDGRQIGQRAGSTKDEVENRARIIFGDSLVDAGIAALEALRLAESP